MNLHIVRNGVVHDSRVLKETRALCDSGLFSSVEIAGFEHAGLQEHEDLAGRKVWRVPLKTRPLPKDLLSQTLKYAEWRHRVVGAYRSAPLSVIHCHDLEPLGIAVRLKQLTGAKLIYDAHELESERTSVKGLRKHVMALKERRQIRHVDAMITVSPSIQRWYQEHFPGLEIALVRNVPQAFAGRLEPVDLRSRLKVPQDALLFIYQGACTPGRGIDLILQAFADGGIRHHVVFMGSGVCMPKIQKAAARSANVHCVPPVTPDAVLPMTAGADAGLSMIEDVSLSYRYCLPNKLFEYWMAGIPVIASALPDQASLVEQYGAGWVVPSTLAALKSRLGSLSRADVDGLRAGVSRVSREVSWDHEAAQLLALYRRTMSRQI